MRKGTTGGVFILLILAGVFFIVPGSSSTHPDRYESVKPRVVTVADIEKGFKPVQKGKLVYVCLRDYEFTGEYASSDSDRDSSGFAFVKNVDPNAKHRIAVFLKKSSFFGIGSVDGDDFEAKPVYGTICNVSQLGQDDAMAMRRSPDFKDCDKYIFVNTEMTPDTYMTKLVGYGGGAVLILLAMLLIVRYMRFKKKIEQGTQDKKQADLAEETFSIS